MAAGASRERRKIIATRVLEPRVVTPAIFIEPGRNLKSTNVDWAHGICKLSLGPRLELA